MQRKGKIFVLVSALALTFFSFFVASPQLKVKADPINISVEGIGYYIQGIAPWDIGLNVSIAVNGTYLATTQTNSSGEYSFPSVSVNPSDVITLYSDGNDATSVYAVNLLKVSNGISEGTITANLYSDILILQSTGSNSITMGDIHTGNTINDSDIDYIYTTDSSIDLVSQNNTSIYVWDNTQVDLTGHNIVTRTFGTYSGSEITAQNIEIDYLLSQAFTTTINSNITFNGDSNQYILQLGEVNGNIVVDKTDGDLTLESDVDINGDFTIASNTQVFTADYNFNVDNLTISNGVFNGSNGSIIINQTLGVTGLYFGGDSTNSINTIQLNDNSYFTASTADTYLISSLSVANSASFQPNGGTFHIIDTEAEITSPDEAATIIFWHLEIADITNDNTDVIVSVKPGVLFDVQGDLSILGLDDSDRVNLRSTVPGTQFNLKLEGGSLTFSADWLDIMDSLLTEQNTGISLPYEPSNSLNSGNTIGWFDLSIQISGTAYQADRVTPLEAGREIVISVNGIEADLVTTDSNGQFTTDPITFLKDDIILLFFTANMGDTGNVFIKADSDSYNYTHNFDIYQYLLTIRGESDNPITETDILNTHPGLGIILLNQGDLMGDTINTNGTLYIPIDSSVDFDSETDGDMNVPGSVILDGSLDVGGRKFSIGGDFSLTGDLLVDETSPGLFFTGFPQYISSNQEIVANVTKQDSGLIHLSSDIAINGDLTISGGTLLCDLNDLYVTGNFNLSNANYECIGGLLQVSEDLTLTSANFEQTGETTVEGTMGVNIFSTATFGAGSITAGNLNVSGSTFTAPSSTTTVTNTLSSDDNSTFNHNNGEVILNGNENLLLGVMTFYDLTKQVPDADTTQILTLESGRTFQVEHNLTLQGFGTTKLLTINSDGDSNSNWYLLEDATITANTLHISDNSLLVDSNSEIALPLNPSNSIDGGRAYGWFYIDSITEPIVSITSPVSNSHYTNNLPIEFILPEAPLTGSVVVTLVSDSLYWTGYLELNSATNYDFNIPFPNLVGLPSELASINIGSIPFGLYTVRISYRDQANNPAYISSDITNIWLGDLPEINVNAPTQTSTTSITNTTISVTTGEHDAIELSNVIILNDLTSATYNSFICEQITSTRVDCTIAVTSSGNIAIHAVTNAGLDNQIVYGPYTIQAESNNNNENENNNQNNSNNNPQSSSGSNTSTSNNTEQIPVSSPTSAEVPVTQEDNEPEDLVTLSTQNGLAEGGEEEQNLNSNINPLVIIIPILGFLTLIYLWKFRTGKNDIA